MSYEYSDKNVESAIEKGLKKLGLSKDEVDIKIIDEGKAGLFGLMGASPAKIRIMPKTGVHAPINWENAVKKAEKIGSMIINAVDKDARLTVNRTDSLIKLNVDTKDKGILIGRRGRTLNAIQHLVNLAMKKEPDTRVDVKIDIGGYKERKRASIIESLKKAAKMVRKSGKPVSLEPMSSGERRIIHKKAKKIKGVETTSQGKGESRRVVVKKSG